MIFTFYRTEITLNFLTSDWFVHYNANTKGKEGGWIFSSRASHADFPKASRTPEKVCIGG